MRRLRTSLDLTQTEFAERIGVSVRTVISWENAQRQPSGPALSLLRLNFPGKL
jgi:putative transcriptional regulator